MKPEGYARTVQAKLGEQAVIAVRPDLPFLFSGPDVLVGIEGKLLAVFFPRSVERRSPDSLLVRFALARLALPQHTRTLLILEPGDYSTGATEQLRSHFERTEGGMGALEAALFLLSDDDSITEPQRSRLKALGEIRREAFARAYVLLEEAQKQEDLFMRGAEGIGQVDDRYWSAGFDPVPVPSWIFGERHSQRKQKPHVFSRGNVLAAMPTLPRRGSAVAQLRPWLEAGVKLQYSLDMGVPYPVRHTVNCLFLDRYPAVRKDPRKITRAAAFSGWAILPQRALAALDIVAASISERLEEARQ